MDVFSASADDLFVSSSQLQSQMESLSNQALQQGINQYSKKNYTQAAASFQRSINMDPNSSYMPAATQYLAQAYLQLNQTDKAIAAYQNAVKRQPTNDQLYAQLGKMLFANNRYSDALTAYQKAAKANPASAANQYSVGQAYLQMGQYNAAEDAFNKVVRLAPESADGYYGLGQTYAKEGNQKRAIAQFQKVINKQSDDYDAYAQMGYAYADMGNFDQANEIADFLKNKDQDLSGLVSSYISSVQPPKIAFAYGTGSFGYNLPAGTPVSALDSYLQNAGAAQSMTMQFQFTKPMDPTSVQNPANWTIARAMGVGPAQSYNFGQPLPATEVSLPGTPDYVVYDSDTMTATLGFTIRQNATADGTIDPSHVTFTFNGKDAQGQAIDPKADEYAGYSGVI